MRTEITIMAFIERETDRGRREAKISFVGTKIFSPRTARTEKATPMEVS